MKNWFKYLISTVVFCAVYIFVEYLLNKNISWKMIVVATVMYAVIYTTCDMICNKSSKK